MHNTLIHIPHASTYIPRAYRASFTADVRRELAVMTDWFCDELFDCGAERLAFPVSRLICDVERFRDDRQESMAKIGMGAVYERCSDLSVLRTVGAAEREAILRKHYDPHHRRFSEAVGERLRRFGSCLIVDAHSFHPTPLPYEPDQDPNRPDFCIGTSGFHTPPVLTETLRRLLTAKGYTVACNAPFSGTIVPMEFYEKDARVTSVMIEVNRGLYLDAPGKKSANFAAVCAVLRECVRAIGRSPCSFK